MIEVQFFDMSTVSSMHSSWCVEVLQLVEVLNVDGVPNKWDRDRVEAFIDSSTNGVVVLRK